MTRSGRFWRQVDVVPHERTQSLGHRAGARCSAGSGWRRSSCTPRPARWPAVAAPGRGGRRRAARRAGRPGPHGACDRDARSSGCAPWRPAPADAAQDRPVDRARTRRHERPAARPGRLGVGVVGAGRVGAVLGSALRGAGHPVVACRAISEASRERAAALLPGVPVLDIPEVVRRAELVLLAVPDDALAGLVQGLADVGAWQAGQIVVHTSGRFGTDVLAPARRAGVIPLALHPAMTFTGTSLDLARLVGCSFAVTAPARCCRSGRRSSSRSAASRSCSPRTPAGSTTRPWRTARTTWSCSSRRPPRRSRPRAWPTRAACSAAAGGRARRCAARGVAGDPRAAAARRDHRADRPGTARRRGHRARARGGPDHVRFQRRAPGDERGDAFRDRGTGDEQGRIAVGQRRAEHGELRAEEQRGGVEPDQRRSQQPDGFIGHRDHFSRPAVAYPPLHPQRRRRSSI